MKQSIILGTRGSALAMWQAHYVRDRLASEGVEVLLEEIRTEGDIRLEMPLSQIGDRGLFTRELDDALVDGRIQLAVHSLKDVPTAMDPRISFAAITEREDPRDVFVAHPNFDGSIDELPQRAIIATSSLRRQAQLRAWRPDLEIVSVRGNVDTRLRKLAESNWHGMILAAAGLNRLGLEGHIREHLPATTMLSAVGQGALGVVYATGDADVLEMVRFMNHEPTERATRAERAFLGMLEGGCQVPIGALGRLEGDTLTLEGCVASLDGGQVLRDAASGSATDPEAVGHLLAQRLLDRGAGAILAAIRRPAGS